MKTMTVIGTIEIKAGQRYRIGSEFAAWFDEIEADAQVATVTADFDPGTGRLGDLHYAVDGTVVACCWAPHFGGVAYGKGEDTRGQRRTKHCGGYGYAYAEAIAKGTIAIKLLPEFEVVESYKWESREWSTEAKDYVPVTRQAYTIRRKPAEG